MNVENTPIFILLTPRVGQPAVNRLCAARSRGCSAYQLSLKAFDRRVNSKKGALLAGADLIVRRQSTSANKKDEAQLSRECSLLLSVRGGAR
jgi:hypothetical protein